MKTFITLAFLILIFTSCEDVIDINLDTIEPQIVIEGTINDIDNRSVIKLSKTTDYFEPSIYPPVSNAIVTVTDNNGILTIFEETEPGIYTTENLTGIENTTYSLNVQSEGENYEAEVTMPHKVFIDSLSFEPTPIYMEFEGGYVVNCHLKDPVEFRNYYRMKAYKKDDVTEAEKSESIFNDDFVNGNNLTMQWESEQFLPNDTIVVELQTLNKSTYYYYFTLFPIVGDGFGSANPANPDTNLNNKALGYFGTFTINRDTIIILPN